MVSIHGVTVDLNQVTEARGRIARYVHRTPLDRSATLSRELDLEVWLKLELFQKTGSFKPRGALNNMLLLDQRVRGRGVITISAGNHAQGVAYAASCLDVHATVVMPESAPAAKVAAARDYGAEVVLHGNVNQAFEKLHELQEERGLYFVHPFDDPHTIAGQGTVGLEIAERIESPDVVVVPVGGGGLIAGVALALKEMWPDTRVVGVEPSGADAMSRSRAAGHPVRLESIDTIADGLAPPFVGDLNFAIAERYVDDLVLVEDAELIDAMRFLLSRVKVMAEPAGAAALAALLTGRAEVSAGETVVCIVSGGNLDPVLLTEYLAASEGARD